MSEWWLGLRLLSSLAVEDNCDLASKTSSDFAVNINHEEIMLEERAEPAEVVIRAERLRMRRVC